MNWMRNLARTLRDKHQAERDYRALCNEGRAPILAIDIRIHPDDLEWADTRAHGLIGIKTTVPLTPKGQRYITRTIRDIRATCIRELTLLNQETE